MSAALHKIHHVFASHGLSGLVRFARKAAWERLPLHPVAMPFGPGHLQIEISGKCNLKCPFCPRTFSDDGWENMSLLTYQRIIRSAPGLWSVNLQGFGEPLLNPELEAILRWTRELGVEVGFATNATLLDDRRARMLLDVGLDWLNISMDGASAETYERLRVGARLDEVLANVRRMVELNRAAGGPIHLALAFVCMRSNLDEVPAFLDLASDVGIRRVVLAPVLGLTAETPSERLGPDQKRRLSELAASGNARGLDVTLGVFGERFEAGQFPCDWPWNKMYVTAEGHVTPCCIETETFIGNVAGGGVAEVWNSAEYRAIRSGLSTGRPHAICLKHCFVREEKDGASR